uniref:Uncharacterized protein n=1 Tax=Tanacetum cinerariifolium TaxID=118510 RepID=A0A6L2K2I5_TANCI|nr:hypothetical protein [Tanacetum cinerariifolium]
MYRLSFDSPSPQPNQGYSPLHINLEMDIENLFVTQEYYAGQGSGQGSSATQDFYTGQDYSMGHGSGQGSGMGGPPDPAEDESLVKEVPPLPRSKVALCKAWIDVSKNTIRGNTMKMRRFWGRFWITLRMKWRKISEDTMPSPPNGKIGVVLELSNFVSFKKMSNEGTRAGHDHVDRKDVEMPLFYMQQNKGSKKSKTPETNSHGISDSAHDDLNLNEEANDYGEEFREVQPIPINEKTSSRLVGEKKKQQESYIQLKNHELEINEAAHREALKLKEPNVAGIVWGLVVEVVGMVKMTGNGGKWSLQSWREKLCIA